MLRRMVLLGWVGLLMGGNEVNATSARAQWEVKDLGPVMHCGIEKGGLEGNRAEGLGKEADLGRMEKTITFLCGPLCAGRLSGSAGERQAAHYLAAQFQGAGLLPLALGGTGSISDYLLPWSYPAASPAVLGLQQGGARECAWWKSEPVSKAGISYNVAGLLPGTDPVLSQEYVVISAHYDHLGSITSESYYPGADDNGSGTAGLVEVAHCLKGLHPQRSIVFLAFSGAEKGLLGSEAFMWSGLLPVHAIKANITLDRMGRNGDRELHVSPGKKPGMVSSLVQDMREMAPQHGLSLGAGMERFLKQSDHYTFAKRDIPSVMISSGVHEDLHRSSDTPDKLNYEKMRLIVHLVRNVVMKVSNSLVVPYFLQRSDWERWQWEQGDSNPDSVERIIGAPMED